MAGDETKGFSASLLRKVSSSGVVIVVAADGSICRKYENMARVGIIYTQRTEERTEDLRGAWLPSIATS